MFYPYSTPKHHACITGVAQLTMYMFLINSQNCIYIKKMLGKSSLDTYFRESGKLKKRENCYYIKFITQIAFKYYLHN